MGSSHLTISDGIVLIILSILVAWGLTLAVDNPLHNWTWSNRGTLNKMSVAVVAPAVGIGGERKRSLQERKKKLQGS